MKRLEIILLAFVSVAVAINVIGINFPGKSVLTVLSIAVLSVVYAFGFLIFTGIGLRQLFKGAAFKEISGLRILGAICFGISLGALLMGMLFRCMHWPGAVVQAMTGVFSVGVVAIIAAIKYAKTKDSYYSRILIRAGIFMFLGALVFSFVPSVDYRWPDREPREFSQNPQQ